MKLRAMDEIVSRILEVERNDMFGWNVPDYAVYLPYDKAKRFLKDDFPASGWQAREYSLKVVLAEMRDYFLFAVGKAENERGISANRSMDHYQNWFWLLGEDEWSDRVWENYGSYGLSKLKAIDEWLKKQGV